MSLIKSISGIRGTIGGKVQENLTPIDAVIFAAAYGTWLKQHQDKEKIKVVIGRDARISGEMIQNLVQYTLIGLGIDVVNIGLSTTPTVEIAVPMEQADGGIILTASHNPKEWNALKLLNNKGEFIDAEDGASVLKIAQENDFNFASVDNLGEIFINDAYMDIHIDEVTQLPLVNTEAIKNRKFRVVVDGVNSTGGIIIPNLLKEHLSDICKKVVEEKADFGIVIDPDVDRLAFICENGEMFGEEYTLVACADYILQKNKGNVVSNLSSSRALRDIAEKHNVGYYAAAVGEVNVVTEMKRTNAVIGGEGNGGIIYPELHYGRDALVGIVLFLSLLAEKNCTVKQLRDSYPAYFMSKNKIQLTEAINPEEILKKMEKKYTNEQISTIDGLKIDFADCWVHLRKSNTEPIIRIYTEAKNQNEADNLALRFINEIKELI